MRYRILAPLWAAAVVLCPLAAQTGRISVYGSKVQDAAGNLANGTLNAQVLVGGHAVGSALGTGGQITTQTVTAPIVNGAFTISLPNTSLTNPQNVCIAITATDNTSGDTILGPGLSCVQPTSVVNNWCDGNACNFDKFVPDTKALGLVTSGPAGKDGANGRDGAVGCAAGAALCTAVIGTSPTGNQTVNQPASTTLTTNKLNGWRYVGDPNGGDILTQVSNAYNDCGQVQANDPLGCYIKVNPRADGQNWTSTSTAVVPRHNQIKPVIDFTGAKITHSGPNPLIDLTGGVLGIDGGLLLVGLDARISGEESAVVQTQVAAQFKIRDFIINPSSTSIATPRTICIDLKGGNQIEITHNILGGCYDAIKFETGEDGYGPIAVDIAGNSLGAAHQIFNGQDMGANITIHENTDQGSYPNDYPVGEFHNCKGLKYYNNYHEYGNGSSTNHMLWISNTCVNTVVEGNTWADASAIKGMVLDEGLDTTFEHNWITTAGKAFVDFGPNILSAISIPRVINNQVSGGYTQAIGVVPTLSPRLPYVEFMNTTSSFPTLDNATNPNLLIPSYYGWRVNALVAPSTGLGIQGSIKVPNSPVQTPSGGDAYACISGTDGTLYKSSTPCH